MFLVFSRIAAGYGSAVGGLDVVVSSKTFVVVAEFGVNQDGTPYKFYIQWTFSSWS